MSHMMKPVEKQQSLRISGDLGHKALTKMFSFKAVAKKKKKVVLYKKEEDVKSQGQLSVQKKKNVFCRAVPTTALSTLGFEEVTISHLNGKYLSSLVSPEYRSKVFKIFKHFNYTCKEKILQTLEKRHLEVVNNCVCNISWGKLNWSQKGVRFYVSL